MKNAIEISGLHKAYKDFALQDIHLAAPCGSIMGFIGENGAGKTTTIKAILGLIRPDSGVVRVLGREPAQARRALMENVGAVLDGSFFSDSMRARDISAVMARIHPRWDGAYYTALCERFALPMEKPCKAYSKGMLAKLRLCTALAHRPRLLVLDEPTSGLDPVVRGEILDLFLEFIEDETHSILLSSHITSDLEHIADYITFIHEGRIVFSKTRDALREEYGVVKCGKSRADALTGARVLGRNDSRFDAELLVDNRAEVARLYPDVLVEPASLDDIMTFLTKGAKRA